MKSAENTKDEVIELYPTHSGQYTFIKPIEPIEPEEEIKPKKETYSQDWNAYNNAKTNEDVLFKKLLEELLFLSIEEALPKPGRKPYSIKDRIFSMCIKVYYKSDLRKAESILKELKNLHYINKVPCFKSIDNFFNSKELNKIIDDLILITAIPLAQLETTGAIDSTGFSISRFDQWFNYKWGKHTGKERVWRKAHAVIGCKTNTFLSVEVTTKNKGDISMLEKVIGNKTKHFNLENFTADKAYSSKRVHEFLHELGLNSYIPFKKNTNGKARGSPIWRKMFLEFKYNKEKFMKKYHARSNIECGFHMIKKRFGDHLNTKTEIANSNEIKIKFLCHNICVLIQEAFENKINIDFEACVKKKNLV